MTYRETVSLKYFKYGHVGWDTYACLQNNKNVDFKEAEMDDYCTVTSFNGYCKVKLNNMAMFE